MKLGFEESQTSYTSSSQSARAWTEAWVGAWAYCPHCGNAKISSFPNNSPLADFFCPSCNEEFELKSQKGKFGARVVDGAFKTKCERLAASNNPNLLLMNYDLKSLAVVNLFIVPKHFSFARSSRNESHSQPPHVAPAGSARISCSAASRIPAKFILCKTGSFARRKLSLRNGRRQFSLETNHRKRGAGCWMS